MQASAPLPLHSSSITDCICTSAAGCSPARLHRLEGRDVADDAGLHVAGAAAIHPAVADDRARRAASPTCRRRLPARHRHGPAAPGCGRASPSADAPRRRCRGLHRRSAAARSRDAPASCSGTVGTRRGSSPSLRIEPRHLVQRRLLVPQRRGAAHQPLPASRYRPVPQRIHSVQDGAARTGIEGRHGVILCRAFRVAARQCSPRPRPVQPLPRSHVRRQIRAAWTRARAAASLPAMRAFLIPTRPGTRRASS